MKAAAWMMGTLAAFCILAVAGRELSSELTTAQIQFWRALVSGAVIVAALSYYGWHHIRTRRLHLHVMRSTIHFGAQFGWFYGVGLIPLSEVFALEFTTPLWLALFAALFLRERITMLRAAAILLGFAGVLVITRPGLGAVQPASLVVLGAALGYAIGYLMMKNLTRTDSPLAILFYMSAVQLVLSLGLVVGDWSWPHGVAWLWTVLVGLASLCAHYCMARALVHADASLVAPLEYLRLPLIAVLGFLIYAEPFSPWVLGGAALVIGANVLNLRAAR
ncbi:MAG: DMT family transporter [Alphaproteobacteria bacterium]